MVSPFHAERREAGNRGRGHNPRLEQSETAKSEGRRACSPAVRLEFDRLKRLRDEAWERDQQFLRRAKHGPYQLLIDILARQEKTSERHYVTDVDTYLQFMRREYSQKL